MGMWKTLGVVTVVVAGALASAAEPITERPPQWAWPGPTPPDIRDALVSSRRVFRPTQQELERIEAIAPNRPAAPCAKPRTLLVWGRLWTHLCNPFTEETVKILSKKTGAFEVVATEDPRMLLSENLKRFDAIFLNGLHDPTPFLPPWLDEMPPDQQAAARQLDQEVKQSLLKFVGEDGKGIASIEGSICALRDWKEFGELMGAFYNGHYLGNFVIQVEDPGHPLTACFGGQPLRIFDQAYVPGPPYSRKNLYVLLSLDLTQTPEPIADPKMAWLKEAVRRLEASTGRAKDYPSVGSRRMAKGGSFTSRWESRKLPTSVPYSYNTCWPASSLLWAICPLM